LDRFLVRGIVFNPEPVAAWPSRLLRFSGNAATLRRSVRWWPPLSCPHKHQL